MLADGCVLPISKQLVQILDKELQNAYPTLEETQFLGSMTFNFQDPDYCAEQGGYHPVEIRISNGIKGFTLDYITDFSYVGSGWCRELAKELDFDLQAGICEARFCGVIPVTEASELFSLFQENFLSYYQMDIFTTKVTLDN
jgi:hypothetical protein